MALKELKGVFPLMPLALKKNQDLDLEGLRSNIRAYEDAGVQGYVSFGCSCHTGAGRAIPSTQCRGPAHSDGPGTIL